LLYQHNVAAIYQLRITSRVQNVRLGHTHTHTHTRTHTHARTQASNRSCHCVSSLRGCSTERNTFQFISAVNFCQNNVKHLINT